MENDNLSCGECGSTNVQKRGKSSSGNQRIKCNECGGWSTIVIETHQPYVFTNNGETAQITAEVEDEIKTADEDRKSVV